MSERADFIVIGAGMAGASAAYHLADGASVVLLERESQPGYHTTGRSAAVFTEIYGNAAIRALTVASGPFFRDPPTGFSVVPLLTSRPLIMLARQDQIGEVQELFEQAVKLVPSVRIVDADEVIRRLPVLRPEYVACGLLEEESCDIDVNAVHMGFLRGARDRGARMISKAEVVSINRSRTGWQVKTGAGDFEGDVIVNAAGAWADEIGGMAGARPIGLVPMRRTAFTFSFEPALPVDEWPTIIDISEEFYFKPETGKLLGSPADETPSPPCDAQPEELDIAIAVDRICAAANLDIRKLHSKWAGLRSFVADRTPVAGYDEDIPGFFWLAGQGGYGIQTSPALSRLAAALARHESIPADIASLGIEEATLSPRRLRSAVHGKSSFQKRPEKQR
jgi:D-arginine dehydrogenase